MNTTIENRDLTKQAPHSPRDRFGDFVILARTTDKCRGSIVGKLGEYHFDCPLDNQLFGFKGIKADEFKKAVKAAKTYEDLADWVRKNGTPKTPDEIRAWSDKMEGLKLRDVPTMKEPEHKKEVSESCKKLGLDFETASLFEWLDADDQASYQPQAELAAK